MKSWKDRLCLSQFVAIAAWFFIVMMASAHVSGSPQFWEDLAVSWGFPTFRVLGDAAVFLSIPALMILSLVCWALYELGRHFYLRHIGASGPLGRHTRRRRHHRKPLW